MTLNQHMTHDPGVSVHRLATSKPCVYSSQMIQQHDSSRNIPIQTRLGTFKLEYVNQSLVPVLPFNNIMADLIVTLMLHCHRPGNPPTPCLPLP